MKLNITIIALLSLLLSGFAVQAKSRYGESLCHLNDYYCIKVKRGDNWQRLWPDPEERDIVRRINRMNVRLRTGMTIAVPKNLDRLTIYDVSPFPRYIDSTGEKTIFVSQKHLAWGAYDSDGELLWWGPVSPGKSYCSDVGRSCKTPAGSFRMIRKQDIECVSSAFPKRPDGFNGGAPMPYCMHFFRGFALHGSDTVPGYKDSHGCVRLFTEDAWWLNQEFINLPGYGDKGTKVIIDAG